MGKAVTLEEKKKGLELHERHLAQLEHEIKSARKLGYSYLRQHYSTMGKTRGCISRLKREIDLIEGMEKK